MGRLKVETRVASLCRDLVRIASPSGQEERVADFAASFLESAGLSVERIGERGESLFVRIAAPAARGSDPESVRSAGPRLFLNSHLDTVPAGEGWLCDPWDVEWSDGRLTGLGANDAKSSVAAMMAAASAWAEELRAGSSGASRGELWLGLTACEETSNAGMTALLAHFDARGLGRPDLCVTGEPTGLEVVRAQSGLAVLEARWSGRSCHAAHVARVEHQNALRLALADLARVPDYTLLEGEHELLGASTLVATVLHAGDRHNRVPDEALAVFDARLAPPHTAAECAAYLAERMPRATIRVRSERLRPVETPAEHALVRVALAAGGRANAIGSATMSDMALLCGVPAIKCGPGQTARSHTPNEYVTEDELADGLAFYSGLVRSLLSGPESEEFLP